MQNSNQGFHLEVKPKNGQQDAHPAWRWVSERGLRLATGEATLAYHVALSSRNLPEIEDIIPADGSLLLVLRRGARVSADWLTTLATPPAGTQSANGVLHEIPVRYGGTAGPDCIYTPSAWAKKSVLLYEDWQADCIVCEVNQGGDMVEDTIHTADKYANVKQVRATKGKTIRAEPIAALAEKGLLHHVGMFSRIRGAIMHMGAGR